MTESQLLGGADAMPSPFASVDACTFQLTTDASDPQEVCTVAVLLPASCVEALGTGFLDASLCNTRCPPAYTNPSCYVGDQTQPGRHAQGVYPFYDGGLIAPPFDGGKPMLACHNGVECSGGNGRAYDGMPAPCAAPMLSPLARHLAISAHLEAASIDAFRILSRELRAHGAPRALVAAARAAAADEVRHARVTRKLARRHAPCAAPHRAKPRPVRSVEAMAVENAVEGCVRETYGALIAHHQASTAADPQIRDAMASIATDETRHAALGWAVAAWAETRLDGEGRARVHAARRKTVRGLRASASRELPAPLVRDAGLPDAVSATRMLAVLEAKLWSRMTPDT